MDSRQTHLEPFSLVILFDNHINFNSSLRDLMLGSHYRICLALNTKTSVNLGLSLKASQWTTFCLGYLKWAYDLANKPHILQLIPKTFNGRHLKKTCIGLYLNYCPIHPIIFPLPASFLFSDFCLTAPFLQKDNSTLLYSAPLSVRTTWTR